MKFLFIRFSSIGDVTQAVSIAAHIKNHFPHAEIHVLTKQEFAFLFDQNPAVHKVWTLQKTDGFKQILQLSQTLSKENFSHLYDSHNNLRSNIFYFLVRADHKLQRSLFRIKRFLLLQFRINLFEKPFSGQRDLLKPLEKWGIPFQLPVAPQIFLKQEAIHEANQILKAAHIEKFYALVPSAAYELKRWPLSHFEKLIELNPDKKFVVLAGPTDHFTKPLSRFPNVLNLTGQTSLMTSAALISKSEQVIANDTGLLHFSEQLGKPTIALMGPAPFGFPSRPSTVILQKDLACRPCSKHGQGPCRNSEYQACLTTITPHEVQKHLIT